MSRSNPIVKEGIMDSVKVHEIWVEQCEAAEERIGLSNQILLQIASDMCLDTPPRVNLRSRQRGGIL